MFFLQILLKNLRNRDAENGNNRNILKIGGKHLKKTVCKYISILALYLFMAWMLPQSLYKDCIGTVGISEEAEHTEEEYKKLFDFKKSEFVICWKWRP